MKHVVKNAETAMVLVGYTVFDPWPFKKSYVDLHEFIGYIDSADGEVNDPDGDEGYVMDDSSDNVLATFSNGTTYVHVGEWLGQGRVAVSDKLVALERWLVDERQRVLQMEDEAYSNSIEEARLYGEYRAIDRILKKMREL